MARRPVAVRDGACSPHSDGLHASLFQPLYLQKGASPGRGAREMISWADPISILNGQMGGGRWDDVFASRWDLFILAPAVISPTWNDASRPVTVLQGFSFIFPEAQLSPAANA